MRTRTAVADDVVPAARDARGWPPQNRSEFRRLIDAIARTERDVMPLTDLRAPAHRLRGRVPDAAAVVHAFALAREAARRALGTRSFDVQMHGGLALASGTIAEMQTGEGKTLAAVAPAFLLSMWRGGVHVLTANDYLARRDAAWMRPAYELLGIRVACVQQGMAQDARRHAYAADVTYATATEVGFDFLRDRLASTPDELVQRPFRSVIVDEIDSILIDEARVPLVVAGGESPPSSALRRAAEVAASLTESVHYEPDLDARSVRLLVDVDSDVPPPDLVRALCARTFARRDVEYVVRDERVEIVDEFKGRTDLLRRWPDGFHGAVEAQEGIEPTPEGRVLSTMTLQSLIRQYPYRAGMTATASASAEELRELYGLEVVPIAPNRRPVRVDHPDVVFATRAGKEDALVDEIATVHTTGRPILVGTASVAESERLAERLRATGIAPRVLNARNDALEAQIVAEAGAPRAVTISTNMAGRGTDIRLGGSDESLRAQVVKLGGLYVIGTNRHDARRIDQQLRGRAGRQGDPGSSRFFVSLEDPLFVRHKAGELLGRVHRLSMPREGPCTSRRVRRELTHAQRAIDWMYSRIRAHLSQFGDVVERQRAAVHGWRQDVLHCAFGHREEDPRLREVRAVYGDQLARHVERDVTLACIDEGWVDHLDTLRSLQEEARSLEAFRERAEAMLTVRMEGIRERIALLLGTVPVDEHGADLASVGIVRPSAKWTYLLGEVPMRSERYRMLEIFVDVMSTGFSSYTEDELRASSAPGLAGAEIGRDDGDVETQTD